MQSEKTSMRTPVSSVVNRSDILEFQAALREVAKAEAADVARFTSPLDQSIARKAYWRRDAIEQCLSMLDQMVLSKPSGDVCALERKQLTSELA